MRANIAIVAVGLAVLGTAAVAQSPAGDALPIGSTGFVCRWGTEQTGRGDVYEIENGMLVTQQTGDTWTILQNNQFGFVATQSQSEYVTDPQFPPQLNRKIVGFWSIAIDRTTGKSVYASGSALFPVGSSLNQILHGICAIPSWQAPRQ